jgi:hypothetical protein
MGAGIAEGIDRPELGSVCTLPESSAEGLCKPVSLVRVMPLVRLAQTAD